MAKSAKMRLLIGFFFLALFVGSTNADDTSTEGGESHEAASGKPGDGVPPPPPLRRPQTRLSNGSPLSGYVIQRGGNRTVHVYRVSKKSSRKIVDRLHTRLLVSCRDCHMH